MSEVDWHTLFPEDFGQISPADTTLEVWDGREIPDWAKHPGDPFTSERYAEVPRITLPGGAHIMAADGWAFILAQSILVQQGDQYVPLNLRHLGPSNPACTFTVNGYLLAFQEGHIDRVGYGSRFPLGVELGHRMRATRHVWIQAHGRLRGLGLQGPG